MTDYDGRSGARVSGLMRSLLFLQSVVIICLSVWLYNEYLSNPYLQTYLSALFRGQATVIALLGLGGILVTAFVGVLIKAGGILGEIEDLSSRVKDPVRTDESAALLVSAMPVLQVVDSRAGDDLSRIHSSLRRWNERSNRRP